MAFKIAKTVVLLIVGPLLGAIMGLWLGMFIGGNFFTDMQMYNMSGYELFGTLGFIAGAILGLVLVVVSLINKSKTNVQIDH